MTRVHERHASAGPSAANRHRRADQKRKASYKVILEEVADKQKKLKTVLYPEQKAPRGYTFIPAGDPQLTNRCKKLAREDGFTVFIVSTSRHPRQDLSREIHRVGFHFPSVTVEKACDSLGVTLLDSGRVLQSNFAHLEDGQKHDGRRPIKQKKQKAGSRNAQPVLDITLPQAVIDTTARETIRDLFPNIPNQDLHVIVGRSFQKGKGLVGTVADLSLVRRAQLAVIAHIRHTYTQYDFILKQVPYNEARRRVERPCLDRLIQWRGDDDDAGDMEDVLREVIVIPDDDEEDDREDETQESLRMRPEENGRDSSVEYISDADMEIQPIDYSTVNRTVGRGDSNSPESDKEIQYLGRNQLRYGRQVQYDQHRLDRMGIHRQRIYEEALDRRRKHPENTNVDNDQSSLPVFASSGHNSVHPLSQQLQDPDFSTHLAERGEQALGRAPNQTHLMRIARPYDYRADPYSNAREPRYVQEEQVSSSFLQDRPVHDGSLEQSKRVHYAEEGQPHNGIRPIEARQVPDRVFDRDERFVTQNDPRQDNVENRYDYDSEPKSRRRSEMVLPSIERDLPNKQGDQTSLYGKARQVDSFGSYQPLNRDMQQLPAPSIINLDDYEELRSSKRRRIDDQQPVDCLGQDRTILVPIEQIDDRRLRYERPHEAAYRDDTGYFASDTRIVPLPPREERTKPPVSHQVLQQISPRTQMEKRPDQVVDRGERYPQALDHHQVPLSRSENVEHVHFPSRSVFALPEYNNDSPSFLDSSSFAPKHHESSDPRFSLRRKVGVNADSNRVYTYSDGTMRHLQPLEGAGKSIPSRFSDMSIDHWQRDDERRPDRVTHIPLSTTANFHRHTTPSSGALTYSFAIATANVRNYAGNAIHLLTYALNPAKGNFQIHTQPPTNTYPPDIRGRHAAATNFDHSATRVHEFPGVQQPQQPVWRIRQNDQEYVERSRANPFERRARSPALRASMEPRNRIIQLRNRPLNGLAEDRRNLSGVIATRQENVRPIWREYESQKGPDNIVVLD